MPKIRKALLAIALIVAVAAADTPAQRKGSETSVEGYWEIRIEGVGQNMKVVCEITTRPEGGVIITMLGPTGGRSDGALTGGRFADDTLIFKIDTARGMTDVSLKLM